jgi:hypothetical protein
MASPSNFDYTTGPTSLPDVGNLSYNGCTFSPLFVTNVSGKVVKDNAQRTTKLMEYRLSVDGYVTLNEGALSISPSIDAMRLLLQQQGGALTYSGRGFTIVQTSLEVAWGPVPELLEFQPLGGGLSAKVKWEVTFRTPDKLPGTHLPAGGNAAAQSPLLQFNYETTLTYGEDYYSAMTIKGTMEIPLTRPNNAPNNPASRLLTTTVDDVRVELDRRIFSGIDLSRFYVVRRNYPVSRDKRTMEFDVAIEEKPYMDMPPFCSIARGSYNVRPAKSGPGLVLWMCTLRGTYTVAGSESRRWAWTAFLLLLKLRMNASGFANIPAGDNQNAQNPPVAPFGGQGPIAGLGVVFSRQFGLPLADLNRAMQTSIANRVAGNQNVAPGAWLIDFSFDEGIYKDSKTVTFSATWRMTTTLSHILLASGIWTKLPEKDTAGNNLWAISMEPFSGALSWAPNYLDPSKDIIIDFGY